MPSGDILEKLTCSQLYNRLSICESMWVLMMCALPEQVSLTKKKRHDFPVAFHFFRSKALRFWLGPLAKP